MRTEPPIPIAGISSPTVSCQPDGTASWRPADGTSLPDEEMRDSTSVDWTLKESARANLRRMVKRLLRKHGYPRERQKQAVQLVFAQAGTLSDRWAA